MLTFNCSHTSCTGETFWQSAKFSHMDLAVCHHGRCQLTGKEDGVKKMAISNVFFFFFSWLLLLRGHLSFLLWCRNVWASVLVELWKHMCGWVFWRHYQLDSANRPWASDSICRWPVLWTGLVRWLCSQLGKCWIGCEFLMLSSSLGSPLEWVCVNCGWVCWLHS